MMEVGPSSAISRLGARLGERRRRARDGERPPLTRDDEENIGSFSRIIEQTIALLGVENDALAAGDVGKVADCYEAKSRLLKDLTLRQPVVEPFLKEDIPEIAGLRDLIGSLAESLKRNGELLEGMSNASRAIISEIETLRRRHSLEGVYDKTGQTRGRSDTSSGRFAKKI